MPGHHRAWLGESGHRQSVCHVVPVITIGDMVRVQRMLIDWFGIPRLLAVTGGSMGGMQALEWAVSCPDRVVSAIPIACTTRHSAQQIAFNEVGRQAIMADPDWNNGDYYGGKPPARGLAVARMVGHITFMSDDSMREKFGRRLRGRRLSDSTSTWISRSRVTCATAAASSSPASTPTRTCTSPRPWITSISPTATARWRRRSSGPRRAFW